MYSPEMWSLAARVRLRQLFSGGSANGLLSWKTLDGKTLKDLEAV